MQDINTLKQAAAAAHRAMDVALDGVKKQKQIDRKNIMKLNQIASTPEVEMLLNNDLISVEYLTAEPEDYLKTDGADYLFFDFEINGPLIVAIYDQAEPTAWRPGENGLPSWEEFKKIESGE